MSGQKYAPISGAFEHSVLSEAMMNAGRCAAFSRHRSTDAKITEVYLSMRRHEPQVVMQQHDHSTYVGVGFPLDRSDGLTAVILGGSYALLSKDEAMKFAADIIFQASKGSQT